MGGFADDDVGADDDGGVVALVDAADGDESSVVGPESGVDVFGLVLGLVSVEPLGPVGLPIESFYEPL